MKRLLSTVLVVCPPIAAVDAKFDAAKAKEGLVMVDGCQWVDPAGNRPFYGGWATLPSTQAQWDQLWVDMAAGGAILFIMVLRMALTQRG